MPAPLVETRGLWQLINKDLVGKGSLAQGAEFQDWPRASPNEEQVSHAQVGRGVPAATGVEWAPGEMWGDLDITRGQWC